jgi:hypothetical protein
MLPFGNLAQMSLMGRQQAMRKQKFARCEWLLWYDFKGFYE